MDILDVDEMLKDDSFHFLEEKNPDDVSNIIQQWKNQNCMQQQPQQQLDIQQQQHNETFKLDSRTFTRPKRRSAVQKLESHFLNTSNGSEPQQLQQEQTQQIEVPQQIQRQPSTPMLNVQIGGQIRHTPLSARSMLQDTSPPSSICSMDTSLDNYNMDNSLITSADFTHLNFLLSTPSLETSFSFNEQNCAGYTLNDMIRDRKALESLTLSADDGTLIKDSQISQIDDISLSLLKGSSGCNSMANSAESVEGSHYGVNSANLNDRTMQMMPNNESNSYRNLTYTSSSGDGSGPEALHRTAVLNSDNAVTDATFTFLGNGQSFIISRQSDMEAQIAIEDTKHCVDQVPLKASQDQEAKNAISHMPDVDVATKKLKTAVLNETMCISKANESEVVSVAAPVNTPAVNETYDCQQLQDELHKVQHTPENATKDNKTEPCSIYESTPHATRMRFAGNKNSYTPAIRKIIEDPNVSPIIPIDSNQQQQMHSPKTSQAAITYCGSPVSRFADMELLENVENPNKTYNRRSRLQQQKLNDERELRHKNTIELQDIMDLAQAEAELLDTNDGEDDEQQFEHMLDELSRIKMNPEQLKMQKSLEKIKKRFNCTLNQGEQDVSSHPHASSSSSEYGSGLSNTFTSETRQETLLKLRNTLHYDTTGEMSGTRSNPTDLPLSSSGSAVGSGSGSGSSFIASSMATSGSSSGERLLNRRSRLNDDISFTSIKQLSQGSSGTESSFMVSSKSLGKENVTTNTGYTVGQKDTPEKSAAQPNPKNVLTNDNDAARYKLTEQRERDRDRFKTIKIVRNRNEDVENATQTILNVPCIDDDHDELGTTPLEGEGYNETVQNANNEQENYKKDPNSKFTTTKRFSRSDLDNSEKGSSRNATTATASALKPPEARSLSRPRYINGLQKFSVVSKAVSAGDLEVNVNAVNAVETKTSQLTRMYDAKRSYIPGSSASSAIAKPANKLKSPMGIKAKSLHNLAYNNQASTISGSTAAQSRIGAYGLRKINSGGFGFDQQRVQKQSQQQAFQSKQKTIDGFKKPQPVTGLQSNTTREKSSSATSRSTAGIARPSSGYYSLNVTAKADVVPITPKPISDAICADESKSSKIAINTGIPKPSGIRPPNKRSGLPRPSSIVRR